MVDDSVVEIFFEKDVSAYLLDSMIKLAIESEEFLQRFGEYLVPKVFSFPRREIVECVRSYWLKNKKALGWYIVDEIKRYVAGRQLSLVYRYLENLKELKVDVDYVMKEVAEVIKQRVLEDGINRAKEAIEKREFNYAEAIITGVFRDVSKLGAFEIEDMLRKELVSVDGYREEDMELCFRTGMRCYDELYGGIWKKEMLLVMGDTNVGKTFCAVYLGKVALVQGKRVLHVTLETTKEVVWERYKMSFTAQLSRRMRDVIGEDEEIEIDLGDGLVKKVGILSDEKVKKTLEFLKKRGARLWLYQGLKFGVMDLIKLMDKLEMLREKVDVVIIDSPDQMVVSESGEELRLRERRLYSRLLDIAKERNVSMIVTTQARRGSKKKFLVSIDDVAEAYDKVRIVDTVWVINQTDEERRAGIVRIYVGKCRFGHTGIMIEGRQLLQIGQFILSPKRIEVGAFLKEKLGEKKK